MHRPQKSFLSSRRKEKQQLESGYQSTYVILMSIIAILLVYYVWIINANATQSYEIRNLENIGKELQNDLNRLESTISELDSSSNIGNSNISKEMESAKVTSYLVIQENKKYVYNY